MALPRPTFSLSGSTGELPALRRYEAQSLAAPRPIEARGTPRAHRGRTEILHPLYELLAPPAGAEPIRPARDPRSDL